MCIHVAVIYIIILSLAGTVLLFNLMISQVSERERAYTSASAKKHLTPASAIAFIWCYKNK